MQLKTLILAISIISIGYSQDNTTFFNRADVFFKTFTKDGRVNYVALKENPTTLTWLVDYLATETIADKTRKAYLINAYNILVIQQIVKHSKLVNSPMKITNFFENKIEMIEGRKYSLNQIENDLIRAVYNDPRVHFVLVCGGLGCPPIANYAYRSSSLDNQLNKQTTLAFNNASFMYEQGDKKSVFLSQIFEWYQSDFGASNKAIITYINTYRKTPFNTDYKVKYYPYDWTINGAEFEIVPVRLDAELELPFKDSIYDPNQSDQNNTEETNNADRDAVSDIINEVTPAPLADLNLQTFTAGSLLAKGKYDLTLFNTLYTENHQFWQGQAYSGYRSTFVTHLAQITYGVTKSKRINIGFDINFKNSGYSTDSTYGGISQAFTYKNDSNSRVGITSVGLRLKLQPFKAVKNFSIQSTFLMPTIKHPEGFNDPTIATNENDLFWADWDRVTWWNQLFLDKNFGAKFQLFTELDFMFRFKKYDSQIGMLDMPASVFFSYFPTNKITVYAMTQHVTRFTNNINGHDPIVTDWVIPMNYTASGFGFKYQILSNLNVELLYTNFWRGKNSGLGETFNIGIKYLTR